MVGLLPEEVAMALGSAAQDTCVKAGVEPTSGRAYWCARVCCM